MRESPPAHPMAEPAPPAKPLSLFARSVNVLAWGMIGLGVFLLIQLSLRIVEAQWEVEATLFRLETLKPGFTLTDLDDAIGPARRISLQREEWKYRYFLRPAVSPIRLWVKEEQGHVQEIALSIDGDPKVPIAEWRDVAVRNPVYDALRICLIISFPVATMLAVRLLLRRRPTWTLGLVVVMGSIQLFWAVTAWPRLS